MLFKSAFMVPFADILFTSIFEQLLTFDFPRDISFPQSQTKDSIHGVCSFLCISVLNIDMNYISFV